MFIETSSTAGLFLAIIFGTVFGILLHKGGVTSYNVIVNQFRLKDFTVVKIMLTAVVVGGIGVALVIGGGLATYHIKPMLTLGVVLGAVLFGIGMVLYGYCPGTGVAAVGTGSLHALAGFGGMIVGGIAYAATFPLVRDHILTVGDFGKVRLPEVIPVPGGVMLGILLIVAVAMFVFIEKKKL